MTTLLYFVNNAHGFYQTVPWCSYMEETKLCHFTAELLIIAHLFALNNEHCFVTVKLMHVHFIMVVVAQPALSFHGKMWNRDFSTQHFDSFIIDNCSEQIWNDQMRSGQQFVFRLTC